MFGGFLQVFGNFCLGVALRVAIRITRRCNGARGLGARVRGCRVCRVWGCSIFSGPRATCFRFGGEVNLFAVAEASSVGVEQFHLLAIQSRPQRWA